jgi:hypothetical protein
MWIDHQREKSMIWLPRVMQREQWAPEAPEKFSNSVVDVFSFLTTIASAFTKLIAAGAPATCSSLDPITLLGALISDIIARYY